MRKPRKIEGQTDIEAVIADSIERHYLPVGAHCPLDKKINVYGLALAKMIAQDVIDFLTESEKSKKPKEDDAANSGDQHTQ